MLTIKNLHVSINDLSILKRLSLQVQPGSIHAIMGPNGSGKSTLANTLMGHPHYQIITGSIELNKIAIHELSPDKRAQAGLFLAFQYPLVLPGVRVATFLKEAHAAKTGKILSVLEFQALLKDAMQVLDIDSSFAQRNLNEGFSGGEKKRLEMLQLLILQPQVAVLDEIDSGLDIDALKIVARGIDHARKQNPKMSFIIITHYQRILNYITPDYVHIMENGSIVKSGDATLAQRLETVGYQGLTHVQQK